MSDPKIKIDFPSPSKKSVDEQARELKEIMKKIDESKKTK